MKKRLVFGCLMFIMCAGITFGWEALTFDDQAQTYTEIYINAQLRRKNNHRLKKVCGDQATYNFLKHRKRVRVVFKSDNQGGENVAYYPAAISGDDHYQVFLRINAVIPPDFTLMKINRY